MQKKGKIILILILIFFVFFIGYKFYINMRKINNLEHKIDILQKKIELTSEKKVKLKKQLDNLNDPDYIEKIAREKLGLVKPGEVLLIPVENKQDNQN